MWKGGGGVPPLFVLGGFRSQKLSKKNVFLEKTLLGNVVNSSVFACFYLLAMEDVIFEFVAIYDVLCMCFLKTL